MFFTHLLHNVTHFPQHVTNVLPFFTWLLWKYLISAFPAVYWKKKTSKKKSKRKDFPFLLIFFSRWVTQFHAPLAYLRRRAMKSVQFWDFRGRVFLKTPEICGHITSPCFGQTALLCDSCDLGCTSLWLIKLFLNKWLLRQTGKKMCLLESFCKQVNSWDFN